ncbi:MAG: HU family DNA-binding protein [Deltaproteobacteria bacterium]|nr:MAG: HU family DNA-binding protein [Deltaproteobacteria bacterium]
MTKAELVDSLYEKFEGEMPKRLVVGLVEGVFDNISSAIKKEQRFSFPGFGTFNLRRRKARKGRNPQTGEAIKIKASKGVGFRAARALKDRL